MLRHEIIAPNRHFYCRTALSAGILDPYDCGSWRLICAESFRLRKALKILYIILKTKNTVSKLRLKIIFFKETLYGNRKFN